MGLKGRLEDLPLLDMLQIIAFSRKSGFLRIAAAQGRGAVVLKEGRVLFSYSWSTLPRLEDLVRHPERITTAAIREQIEISLRELGSLREGHFQFELADPRATDFGGLKVQPFLLPEGLDAQELLLDLAVEIDNERREATSLLELAFEGDPPPEDHGAAEEIGMLALPSPEPTPAAPAAPARPEKPLLSASPAPAASRLSVVLVDDEAPVRQVVSEELEKRGHRVVTASNPGGGANAVRERMEAGDRVIVVVDLKMPTSSERSFFGGFELVRRVKRTDAGIPVLLMAESLSEKAKERAKELGIRRIVFKPTLSKIDAELYGKDLRAFAGAIHEQVEKLREESRLPGPGNGDVPAGPSADGGGAGGDRAEFLAAMTRKLVEPGGSTDVSRLVMQVAARFLERGVLFVVKGDVARGLAAFGIGGSESECAERAQRVAIEVSQCAALSEVVRRASSYRVATPVFAETLHAEIGAGRAREAVLIPLLFNRVTLLLLYGDNAATGRELGELGGLELFIAQSGMALENKLLQRKLSSADLTSGETERDARA